MARVMRKDTTDVYRFKLTTTVMQKYWTSDKGYDVEETTSVRYVGYYSNKYQLDPWVPSEGYFKVEHQKLSAVYDEGDSIGLGWETIASKEYQDGERI